MNKIILYYKFVRNKILDKKPLVSNFLNTKPKLRTIQPDVRLSYNEIFMGNSKL